jgi:secondary thiamine-phosphate synthase enzyme
VTAIEVRTARRVEARDITEQVRDAAGEGDRVLWLSTPHTTTALVVNEADDALLRDLERTASLLLRPLEPFTHARRGNPNAAAHVAAALFGRECLVRVRGGELVLGEHQRVLMLELDGPQTRRVHVDALAAATPEVAT